MRGFLKRSSYYLLGAGLTYNLLAQIPLKKSLDCADSEIESRYGRDSIKEIEKDLNKQKDDEPDFDIPFEMMDEESLAELQASPDNSPEAYKEMMKSIMYTPPAFKSFNQNCKCPLDDEMWNGLRLTGSYSPLQSFKFDVESNFEQNARSTKYNFVSMIQNQNNPTQGLVIVGRNDVAYVHSMQLHATLSQFDRLSIVANFKKNDLNQCMYEMEYNKSFERLNLAAKLSNMGSSMALTANAYKNFHLGIETHLHPKTGEILYSYGVNHKPHPKVAYSIMYLSYVPMISFDLLYMVSLLYKLTKA